MRTQTSVGSMMKRVPPRSSLAPPAASLSDLPGAPALVYKCPITGCERIFATKLALKRHFQVYQHEAIFDGPLESVLVVNPSPTGSEGSEGSSTAVAGSLPTSTSPLAKVLPKLYKCPVLQCLERFPTENELAAHWRYMHPTLKGSLGEWSSLLYEFDSITLTPVEHPATYLKEIEGRGLMVLFKQILMPMKFGNFIPFSKYWAHNLHSKWHKWWHNCAIILQLHLWRKHRPLSLMSP